MTKPSAPIRDELFAEPLTQPGLFTFNEVSRGRLSRHDQSIRTRVRDGRRQ